MVRIGRAMACVLMVISVGVVGAGCSHFSTWSVPAPSATASPGRVASVYLRAALFGDCHLTARLTLRQTWHWCSDPKLLSYRYVGRVYHVPASEAGRSEECVNFQMRTDGSSDGTIPAGWAPWGFCFVKTTAGWRLYDQGTG